MGYNINDMIKLMQQEDGYVEKKRGCPTKNLYDKVGPYAGADNYTKYWKDLTDMGLPNYQGSYYCIATIFWAMAKAYGLKVAQKLCLQNFMINCQATYNLFKQSGQVYNTPQVGDIIVFWGGNRFHHAEAVTYVKGDVVKTFGANTTAVTSVTVYNGGGCRYNKVYSLRALQAARHKFLRPKYGEQFKAEWIKTKDNKWMYRLEDGTFARNGWGYIDGWYYFDINGIMQTGWIYDKSQWYYLSDSGKMEQQDWKLVDGKWVYFGQDGSLHKGWLLINGVWYYLTEEDGTMATGLKQINRMWYFFNDDGSMIVNAWHKINDIWYFFSNTGAAYLGQWKQEPDGKYYYLGSDGKMATKAYIKDKVTDVYYYVDENGVWDGKELKSVLGNGKIVN